LDLAKFIDILLLSKLEHTGTDWSKLEHTGTDWSKLEQAGASQSKLDKLLETCALGCFSQFMIL